MALVNATFYSQTLKRQTSFIALLPNDFMEIPNYPIPARPLRRKTLYLLHGYTGGREDWAYGTPIRELSLFRNLAIILPTGDNSFYLDDPDIGAYYGEFVGRELVEFTRSLFGLSTRRDDTLIGGLSMGGYGAIRNGLKYHETFGGIIALSSALITNTVATMPPGGSDLIADYAYYTRIFGNLTELLGSDKDPQALVTRLKATGASMPRMYLGCGTEDFLLEENRTFHRYLESQGVEHCYFEGPGTHDYRFWGETIVRAADWVQGWAP